MAPRIYADYAASAPLRPEALQAYIESSNVVNPAGQYATGRQSRKILEESRENIAEILGADPVEVIFTGSGTEADNIALSGHAYQSRNQSGRNTVYSAPIEHPAVLETVKLLEKHGFRYENIPVDKQGRADFFALNTEDLSDTAVATLMWANNETGAIQPIDTFLKKFKDYPTHIDAVQVMGHQPIDFHTLGASTVAGSAHKFGGPKGQGILLARREIKLDSPLRGGGQERGIRPGTVDVPSIAATAAALEASMKEYEQLNQRLKEYQAQIIHTLHTIQNVIVHTSAPSLPSHIHVSFPGAEGDSLIMLLDAAGVDASTGSACAAGVNRASHVLAAMGVDTAAARGALRLTLGPATTQEDVTKLISILPGIVEQARSAGMAYQ